MRPSLYQTQADTFVKKRLSPLVDQQKMVTNYRILLGQGRYAMETWIGSHPFIQPCDLSNSLTVTYWLNAYRKKFLSKFNFSLFWTRRTFDEMLQNARPPYNLHDLNSIPYRMLNSCFLGSMIMKWNYFYGEQPPSDSWMWSYYPDGATWKEGMKLHGASNVYNELTKPYWPNVTE